jgi:hypothetical protein
VVYEPRPDRLHHGGPFGGTGIQRTLSWHLHRPIRHLFQHVSPIWVRAASSRSSAPAIGQYLPRSLHRLENGVHADWVLERRSRPGLRFAETLKPARLSHRAGLLTEGGATETTDLRSPSTGYANHLRREMRRLYRLARRFVLSQNKTAQGARTSLIKAPRQSISA